MAATGNEKAPRCAGGMGKTGLLALFVGLLAGLVLYLPWETVWNAVLHRVLAERLPGAHVFWQSLDHAGPLGFRLNGVVAGAPGWPVSPRAQSVVVRLGVSPRLSIRAATGGRELHIVCLETGDFDVSGSANLACLGRRDFLGSVDVRADGRVDRRAGVLESGLLDLRGKALQLPGGLWLGDAVLALEYKAGSLRIRNFTLREPLQVRVEGTAALTPGGLLESPYAVSGEIVRGQSAVPFRAEGRLNNFFGGPSAVR